MEKTKRFLKIFSVASVILWIALLLLLNRRISSQTLLELDPKMSADGEAVLRDEWLGVFLGDSRVGYTNLRLARSIDEKEYEIHSESGLSVNVAGAERKIHCSTLAIVDADLSLKNFKFILSSNVSEFTVNGILSQDHFVVNMLISGQWTQKFFPLDELPVPGAPIVLPEMVRFHVLQQRLQPGKILRLNMVDPVTMSLGELTAELGEPEEIETLKGTFTASPVRQEFAKIVSTVWLDDGGEVVCEKSEMGGVSLTSERRPRSEVINLANSSMGPDLLINSRIPCAIIPNARKVSRMRVKIDPLNIADFPNSGLDLINVQDKAVEAWSDSNPKKADLPESERKRYLESTVSMPTQNEKIEKLAKRLVADVTLSTKEGFLEKEIAARIARWVHESMTPEPVLSFPNAADVLKNLRGDCNEHAVLFGALARAAGIPTRLCSGLMYLDGYYYYHAWNEVYADGEWHLVDTTLAQQEKGMTPVDATHLKLVEGELDQQIALLSLIGKIHVNILEVQHREGTI